MARSGPQYYPPASRAYWYEDNYGGSAMEVNCCCWHSTEGTSLPSYGGGASAPTLTVKPNFTRQRMEWWQHFRIDTSARALANKAGGVETNTANVVQVEVVGTCDRRHARTWRIGSRTYTAGVHYLYMGALPDWAVRDLAAFAEWLHDEHGVPLRSGLKWPAYPESYGANGVRMSGAEWRNFYGHCGHMHVPENDHGDPGAFPAGAILARAAGAIEEDDVQLTDADVRKLANTDGIFKAPSNAADRETNASWTLSNLIATAVAGVLDLQRRMGPVEKAVAGLQSPALSDDQLGRLAAQVAADPTLAETIAERTAQLIAARLAE